MAAYLKEGPEANPYRDWVLGASDPAAFLDRLRTMAAPEGMAGLGSENPMWAKLPDKMRTHSLLKAALDPSVDRQRFQPLLWKWIRTWQAEQLELP